MRPEIGEKDKNLRYSLELVATAADNGAKLIVLPELCTSGYVFVSRPEAWSLAEEIPDGPTVAAWAELCRERGVHLAC
jgi:predicted amidohydrolase